MSLKEDILARLSGEGEHQTPLYLPDLALWYDWRHKQGTLPDGWQDYSLPQTARAMGAPVWLVGRPWRVETPGVEVVTTEADQERVIEAKAPSGVLVSRWVVGPDGQWWQTEYPVKSEADLAAAVELAQARTYVLDTGQLARWEAMVGDDGVLAIEIPRRPYSDLLHEFLGWSEGLLLLAEPAVEEILAALEEKLRQFIPEIAQLPGQVVLSLDNLDGQFISPAVFEQHLKESYQVTVEALRDQDKRLVVHIGGPIKRILAALAETGVDGIEGLAGPPQSDLTLAEARQLVGPDVTLWGGISQDFVLEARDWASFEAAVAQAVQEARGDRRMLIGVADRVPVDAELSRLQAIPELVGRAGGG